MKKTVFFLLLGMVVFQCCVSTKKAVGPAPVTYTSGVQQIIVNNCSPCHIPPNGSKKALDNYLAVRDNIDEIITRISLNPGERGFMPFKHDKLSDSLINVFVQWKGNGFIEK